MNGGPAPPRPAGRVPCGGFTLLEVLIALVVIAIPLLAIMESVTLNVSNAVYLRDRTMAHWVAMNAVAQEQLAAQWTDAGEYKDEVTMVRKTWYSKVKVSTTDDQDVRRLDVEVRADKDAAEPLETLVAYLQRPQP